MNRVWSFGQKMGFGFFVVVALTAINSIVTTCAMRTAIAGLDYTVSVTAQNLIEAERLLTNAEAKSSAVRGFLLTGDAAFLERLRELDTELTAIFERLRRDDSDEKVQTYVTGVQRAMDGWDAVTSELTGQFRRGIPAAAVERRFDQDIVPRMRALRGRVQEFVNYEQSLLQRQRAAAAEGAYYATVLGVVFALAATVFATLVALVLVRALNSQIGTAVQHIQSSSGELQTVATQQASSSREQSSAMNEITVTIEELLATARQIAESAQRVARIAEDTARAADGGDETIQRTQETVQGIKRQVDLIVTHMLELGQKSRQIGGILEIINELSEQTNILAINATIEASGAGEAGRRFATVADEIRKLADRVGASTKEIRTLIEEVRAAVHTTVMATESGSKSVDAGTRQFAEVTLAFQQIASLVGTTTEVAREIELSTKQQSTAVEQVNIATSNVAQTTRESETSAAQTVQTASDLARLSGELTRLIRPNGKVRT